jgi:hypothetical protein
MCWNGQGTTVVKALYFSVSKMLKNDLNNRLDKGHGIENPLVWVSIWLRTSYKHYLPLTKFLETQ